jgi:hypothetical protein
MSPQVETRAQMRRQFDDMCYDASEEESECEMETTVGLQQPVPILDAPPRKRTAVSEPIQRTLPEQTLAPTPAGYSTSDDEDGAQKQRFRPRKVLVFRRASWPESPSSPKTAHDSGVQGIEDTASGSEREGRNRKRRSKKERYVLTPAHDEAAVAFKGIADADSSEERWKQITLEEHMDKIFNAVPPSVKEGSIKKTAAVINEVARESLDTDDGWGCLERKKPRFRERILTFMHLFGCGEKFNKRRGARIGSE